MDHLLEKRFQELLAKRHQGCAMSKEERQELERLNDIIAAELTEFLCVQLESLQTSIEQTCQSQ